jgi:hypothetical protein
MAGATESPATDNPLPSAGPAAPANATTLRVRERPVSQGPIDSLFHSLFGGLFGW